MRNRHHVLLYMKRTLAKRKLTNSSASRLTSRNPFCSNTDVFGASCRSRNPTYPNFQKASSVNFTKGLINTDAGFVLVEVLFQMSGAGCSVSAHLPDTCPEEKYASWQHGPVYDGNTKPVAQ